MNHMESMLKEFQNNSETIKNQENELKECIGYLEAHHGPFSHSKKKVIRDSFKTLIDRLLPDFVKSVILRSEDTVKFDSEEFMKMMRCSKYQFNEFIKRNQVSDWEKMFVLMDLNKEQMDKMRELKIFAQKSRKEFTK